MAEAINSQPIPAEQTRNYLKPELNELEQRMLLTANKVFGHIRTKLNLEKPLEQQTKKWCDLSCIYFLIKAGLIDSSPGYETLMQIDMLGKKMLEEYFTASFNQYIKDFPGLSLDALINLQEVYDTFSKAAGCKAEMLFNPGPYLESFLKPLESS